MMRDKKSITFNLYTEERLYMKIIVITLFTCEFNYVIID